MCSIGQIDMNRKTTFSMMIALSLVLISGCDMTGFSNNPAKRLIKKRCSGCHSTKRIYGSRRSSKEWEEIVARMIRHGAKATGEERDKIIDYLKKEQTP